MTSSESLPCIFCQAPLPPMADASSSSVMCPQCGQVNRIVLPTPARPPGKKVTAKTVLGIMGVMAVIGLAFALATIKTRRDRDIKGHLVPKVVEHVPPAGWEALTRLPAGMTAVAGMHFTSLRTQQVAGFPLTNPPFPPGLAFFMDKLKAWTRINPAEIEHVVVGAKPGPNGGWRAAAVVVTQIPYDPKEVALALIRSSSRLERLRPFYQFAAEPMGEAAVWCLDDRLVVFLWSSDRIDSEFINSVPDVADEKKPNSSLAGDVKTIFETRLPKQSFAWSVTAVDPATKATLEPLTKIRPDLLAWFEVRKGCVSLQSQEGTLTALVQIAGESLPKTRAMATAFSGWSPGHELRTKVEPPPDMADDPAAQWTTLQLRGSASSMKAVLNDLFGP